MLDGFEIICWDESNCSFDENEFVRKAADEKRWGFLSDYYRLKALYNIGGIYLDTDVEVFRDFVPLLNQKCFLNFIYDCVVGMGIVGSQPKNPFIFSLLQLYEKTTFIVSTEKSKFLLTDDGHVITDKFETNNRYVTSYILKHYPEFKLNNKYQNLGDFAVYPKELFEIGTLTKRQFTIHYATVLWKEGQKLSVRKRLVNNLYAIPYFGYIIRVLKRKIQYKINNKKLMFYPYQVAQKKGLPMPPIE